MVPFDLQPAIDFLYSKKRALQNNYKEFKPGNKTTPFRYFSNYKISLDYYLKNEQFEKNMRIKKKSLLKKKKSPTKTIIFTETNEKNERIVGEEIEKLE